MRSIAIGDIHGCIVEFRQLVDKLELGPEDNLVLVGVLMDKGPDPVACVRYARELGAKMVLGNHEEKHLRWRAHEDRVAANPKGKKNPMKPLGEKQAAENAALSAEDITWMRGLPLTIQVGNWVVVHGGLMPWIPLDQQTDDRLRLRWVNTVTRKMAPVDLDKPNDMPPDTRWWMEVYDGPNHVVYGHAAHGLQEPRVDRNALGAECWGIDTGCAYGGRLTALVLETREVIQVPAERTYARWFGGPMASAE